MEPNSRLAPRAARRSNNYEGRNGTAEALPPFVRSEKLGLLRADR
jgi:hypothetical protein